MPKLKCRGCGDRFEKDSMYPINGGNYHSIECASTYGREKSRKARDRALAKAQRNQKAVERDNSKALKEYNRRDVRWQHKKTQPAFNKMRKLQELKWFSDRGLEPLCISCALPLRDDQWCCGHFKTVGSNGLLRYSEINTYLQHNKNCNMSLSGNIEGSNGTIGYKKGLVKRFGEDEGLAIIEYCETNNHIKKWEWQELDDMRKEFNAKIRALIAQ